MLSARPVRGTFRSLRSAANVVLIAILFAIPWIRIGSEPLVLLDIPSRKFHVFGLVIFPEELFFLWLIVIGLAIALFFFTALAGRLWCGWACPQTVFTDVYAGVARRIQGWTGSRAPRRVAVWRKVATHAAWIVLSAVIGFHLVGYFRSPYTMLGEWSTGAVSRTSMGFLVVATALAYFDFAIVRQLFCKVLCPYARFQSVLFDRDTLVVGYDAERGEPRGKLGKTAGACVDCGLCVAVCPTGIDIREGLQLECIACTQCIDACNGVMAKTGQEPDLIAYRSLSSLESGSPARLLRPRVAIYGALLVAVVVAFGALLERRLPMDLHVFRTASNLYDTAADGRVSNAFTLRIENRDVDDRSFRIGLREPGDLELLAGLNPIPVPAASATETRVFVLVAAGGPAGSREIDFFLEPVDAVGERLVRPARFVTPGPGRSAGGGGGR